MCGIKIVKISYIEFKNWLKICIMVGLQQPLSKTFVKKGATNQQAMGIWNVGIQFSKFQSLEYARHTHAKIIKYSKNKIYMS